MTYSNLWPNDDWSKEHLNWALVIYSMLPLLPFYIVWFAAAALQSYGSLVLLFLIPCIAYLWGMYLSVWNLTHKGRSLWNLLYLFIPWIGWIVFLCVRKRDVPVNNDQTTKDSEVKSYVYPISFCFGIIDGFFGLYFIFNVFTVWSYSQFQAPIIVPLLIAIVFFLIASALVIKDTAYKSPSVRVYATIMAFISGVGGMANLIYCAYIFFTSIGTEHDILQLMLMVYGFFTIPILISSVILIMRIKKGNDTADMVFVGYSGTIN